jgi:hypothetical protein
LPKIAAGLPDRSDVKVQPRLLRKRAEIDIYSSPESVPTCESLWLHALEVPERIADVLQIESHSAIKEARPLATPLTQQVPVRTLAGFVAVWSAERFLLLTLGVER